MNRSKLINATLAGAALQLAMCAAGHYVGFIRDNVFALGGLSISFLAGALYGWRAQSPWTQAAGGGAIAGALCALLGIAVSAALGDVPPIILAIGTTGSAITGALGGVIARML
jgi:hypothetical protein